TLAIVGRPNVGKSSLFNLLVERERAIVTATPGTTRDLVTETVSIEGIPVKLVDTAGIRRALDEAESIGIRKSMEALADADLVLVVLDASQEEPAEDQELLKRVVGRQFLVIENKTDLVKQKNHSLDSLALRGEAENSELSATVGGDNPNTSSGGATYFSPWRQPWVGEAEASSPRGTAETLALSLDEPATRIRTSALTGEGIAELRAAILNHVTGGTGSHSESGFLTNARHQSLVRDSLTA